MKIPIGKYALHHIIAPHGLTDIIHAIEFKKIPDLIITYSTSFGVHYVLNYCNKQKINVLLFLLSSAFHFRLDMPYLHHNKLYKPFVQLFESVLLIFFFVLGNIHSYYGFLLYMCIFHVPNHYRMNFQYLWKNGNMTLFLFSLFHLFSYISMKKMHIEKYKLFFQSIIVGHIFYHEFCVRNDIKNALENIF